MLLYLCLKCGSWKLFLSLAEILKLSKDISVVSCSSGCGLMVQVQPTDRLQIIPAPVEAEESREQVL